MSPEERRAALLARARDMVPALRARAAEIARHRRLPADIDRAFRDAGFYRVLQPTRYGGDELDYGVHTEIATELGRGCGSSAWVASILACHALMVGMFAPEAQDEVWGTDASETIATSFLPVDVGVAEERGGLRLRGRWKFSSGCELCSWVILVVTLPPDARRAAPDPLFVLLPRRDWEIDDTWFASALAGTGSHDITVADAFVPAHRIVRFMDLRGGPTPGSAASASHLYRLPLMAVFSFNLIGPAIGAAKGAVELVAAAVGSRQTVTNVKLAEMQSVHMRIAEAEANVLAAEEMLAPLRARINEDGRAGRLPSIDERVRYRLATGFAARLCVQAVDAARPLLGARALIADDPVERAWRDVHGIAQHIGLTWDIQALQYGAVRLGLPCPDPRL